MAQEIFKRYEIKYLIPFSQYLELKEKLLEHMHYDSYGNPEGKYNIVSLYYDSEDARIYHETRNRLPFRQKLRLRIYDQADLGSTAFIEIKQKYKDVVNKRRTLIPLGKAYEALGKANAEDVSGYMASNDQILKEALHFKQLYQLKPDIIVSYDRQAFVGIEQPDLRVTFDYNLMCRRDNLSIEDGPQGSLFIDPNLVVLEVKVSEAVPFWLARLLSDKDCGKQSVSKFCTSIDLLTEMELKENM